MAELSSKAATATKGAVTKVADAGRDAVSKTSEAVTQAVESKKERKEIKSLRNWKIQKQNFGMMDLFHPPQK